MTLKAARFNRASMLQYASDPLPAEPDSSAETTGSPVPLLAGLAVTVNAGNYAFEAGIDVTVCPRAP